MTLMRQDEMDRAAMIRTLRLHGVSDRVVLKAMACVRRHAFLPEAAEARDDP